MIFPFFRRAANRRLIERLHGQIVAAARNRILFTEYAIEDTFEGRFEAVTLHAALVLRRLNAMAPPAPEMAQDLVDALFRHFEMALREMGVGDIAVPKRMKSFAEAFVGRGAAYDLALSKGETALAAALARNVYADRANPDRLARYVGAADRALAKAPIEAFTMGPVPFPEPSAIL
ncbi:ubiquinol-cytochrome C chaperone family protein [Methylocapsa polymorpha]|uniref:Ubiquinol-cytochrome C chaperone family protein n=1 Tax=Methylocapsa polymorpha TaxID=3080828 RepID=A0ABZ0HQA4_9HYPH|nr:ubiquinol-cytochrome C chaperone family protein [Methylocapsa sp. RX1]